MIVDLDLNCQSCKRGILLQIVLDYCFRIPEKVCSKRVFIYVYGYGILQEFQQQLQSAMQSVKLDLLSKARDKV